MSDLNARIANLSPKKRALLEQKLSAPQDVGLGETTLDEMCLGAINVIYKVK